MVKMKKTEVDHVACWPAPHCSTRYSVSACAADGSEVKSLGGDDDLGLAWELATECARELGVRAIRYRDADASIVAEEWSAE